MSYRYLFPFEKIPAGSNILIYGAGTLGQDYLKQLLLTKYCRVIGFVDRNYASYPNMIVPVYPPAEIHSLFFDYIVIALRAAFALSGVLAFLEKQGVEKERIAYVLERDTCLQDIFFDKSPMDGLSKLSCNMSQISAAIYLGGGLGDMINQKRFVVELMRFNPAMSIDLYAIKNIAFLQWLYSDCLQVKQIIPDLGTRYEQYKRQYQLSISIIATFFLEIDHFEANAFAAEFVEGIQKVERQCHQEALSIPLPNGIAYKRRIYNRENCYTWFNHSGAFSIEDFHVGIPLLDKYMQQYNAWRLGRYITVNIGNGTSVDGSLVAKSWPMERFQKTVDMFKRKYADIKLVQVGSAADAPLRNADRYVMGQEFGLIAHVLKSAIFHLDIEGGLVHLASQLDTKCIVLFGPTPVEYFGYDNNINIKVGSCLGCYGLYADTNQCARHLCKPDCMYSITPEIVMEAIDKYMTDWVDMQEEGDTDG